MAGAEPAEWRRLTMYGCPAEYGILTPAYIGGAIQMLYPSSVADENPADLIVPELRKWPARGGPRGQAITTPYWVVRGHTRYEGGVLDTNPRIPMWVGVDMVGRIYYLMRDGSVQLIAQVPLATYCNDFSYFDHARKTMWMVDTAAGAVLRVQRSGNEFTSSTWAKVPGLATSVRAIGTKLYVANGASVIEIDALDQSAPQRVVCSLPDVFWVDYLSTGRLVVMTNTLHVHIVDPATGAIGPDLMGPPFRSDGARAGWVMVDVDRNGTCGPVDSIYCVSTRGLVNSSVRIAPDGSKSRIAGTDGGGRALAGLSNVCIEAMHYGWLTAIHPDEGLQMLQGGAQILPIVYAAVGAADPWPAQGLYDHGAIGGGWEVVRTGGDRPFVACMGSSGNSMLGLTPDHLTDMPVADAVRFVRAGMLSVHERQLTDAQVANFLRWACAGSQAFQRDGRAAMARLEAGLKG